MINYVCVNNAIQNFDFQWCYNSPQKSKEYSKDFNYLGFNIPCILDFATSIFLFGLLKVKSRPPWNIFR